MSDPREQLIYTRLLPMLGALDQPIESMSGLELAQRIADAVLGERTKSAPLPSSDTRSPGGAA